MNQAIYRNLMRDFTRQIGLNGPAEEEACHFLFKDVALTIFFNESDDARVNVCVDFGSFPRERTLEIFRRLLEINLLVGSQGSPRLGVDPESGRVIFSYAYPLAGLTAHQLLASLDLAVRQAIEWRQSFYLDKARARDPDLRGALMV